MKKFTIEVLKDLLENQNASLAKIAKVHDIKYSTLLNQGKKPIEMDINGVTYKVVPDSFNFDALETALAEVEYTGNPLDYQTERREAKDYFSNSIAKLFFTNSKNYDNKKGYFVVALTETYVAFVPADDIQGKITSVKRENLNGLGINIFDMEDENDQKKFDEFIANRF